MSVPPYPPTAPLLPINVQRQSKRKRALGALRGGVIEIFIPKHWPLGFSNSVIEDLAARLQQQFNADYQLVQQYPGPLITFDHKASFVAWVHALNNATLQHTFAGIRLGHARYTQLAQMNLRTRVMTVSKHCLHNVPEEALRYLVVHELAHLDVPNHSKAFWQRVAEFVPDYRTQKKVMAAFHRMRVFEADTRATNFTKQSQLLPPHATKPWANKPITQLLLQLFSPTH